MAILDGAGMERTFPEMLLPGNRKLRRNCGFDEFRSVPGESVLSRGFTTLASLGVAELNNSDMDAKRSFHTGVFD